jgi:hypothetical protein
VPFLLIATAAVLLAATLIAARLPDRGVVAYLAAVALLANALVIATLGIAGLLVRSLQGPVLLLLALGWGALAIVVPVLLRRPPLRARERLGSALGRMAPALREPAVALAFLLAVGTLAWRVLLAVRLPVTDYDGFSYHLVFVDIWLQHDALTLVPQRPWTAGYPAVTELLTTWLAAFTRTDALTGFTGLLPIPLGIAAVTGLARSLGAAPRWALLGGLLFAMTPALVSLAGTTYVDAASVSAVIATWWLGLRVVRGERDGAAALLLGIAGGIALGSKGTNALLVAPILVAAGLALIASWLHSITQERRSWVLVGRLVLLATPVLLIGGSWYLKNLAVYGNPLYPFSIGPLHGVTTLADFAFTPPQLEGKGKLAQLAASWTTDWHLTRYAYNVRPGGLGRAWPLILVVAAAGAVVLVRRRRFDALALVALPAALTLLTMPMPWYARLTLFLPGIALPVAAVALDALTAIRPRLASLAGLALVTVAAISLVFVNIRPNLDISAAFRDGKPPGPLRYLGYVLDPSDARRLGVSLRGGCAGFAVVAPGDQVAPGGFNLLGAVAGPGMDRRIGDPLPRVTTAAELADAVREQGSRWLVTGSAGSLAALAEQAPDRFLDHGVICEGGRLWELLPAAGS